MEDMKQAFIIMQIGNSDLDKVCEEVFVPALKANNLDPKRVDKHNKGGLLKSEITAFIETSSIIIADLTNERPNCYLEVGYAMGREKYPNVILTAREDHNPDSPNHKKDGPKVHFDLTGYDILWWKPNELEKFKEELEKRIRRRLKTIVSEKTHSASPFDEEWVEKCENEAFSDFQKFGKASFIKVKMALRDSKLDVASKELLRVAEKVQLPNTGWAMGLVLHSNGKRPRPTKEGISARIMADSRSSYDYWALKKDGEFYLLRSLTENEFKEPVIAFDIRIVRITEALLYSARLYSALGASDDSQVVISISHGGLKDHAITRSDHFFISRGYKSNEDEVTTEIETTLGEIVPNIVDLVEKFTKPLFTLFDFFDVQRETLEKMVNDFTQEAGYK